VAGYAAGLAAAVLWSPNPEMRQAAMEMVRPGTILLVLVAAPLLAGVAAWIPAALAARQDPAEVLRSN
jgi:ABC-type antimicrobial peptide transport system permease subunit